MNTMPAELGWIAFVFVVSVDWIIMERQTKIITTVIFFLAIQVTQLSSNMIL